MPPNLSSYCIGGLMKRLISCEFNMDTSCVELIYTDGTVVAIDTNSAANSMSFFIILCMVVCFSLFHHNLLHSLALNGLNVHQIDTLGHARKVDTYMLSFETGAIYRLSQGVHDAHMA